MDEDLEIISDGEPVDYWSPPPAADWQASGEPAVDALRQLNGLLPASQQQQQVDCVPRGGRAFVRSAKPAAPAGSKPRAAGAPFRRQMKTAAAADADRAAAERAAADAAELAVAVGSGGLEQGEELAPLQAEGATDAPQRQPRSRPAAATAGSAAPRPAANASFLNRKVLPRPPSMVEELRQKLQPGGAVAAAAEVASPAVEVAASEPAAAAEREPGASAAPWHPQPPAGSRTMQPAPLPVPPRPAVAAPMRSAPAAAAVPTATFHRTADGLNVVYLNRQAQHKKQQEEDEAAGVGKGRFKADVNSGWGNNFVRIDLKKGKGSTKYVSKHGSKKRKKAGGRFGSKWQTSRLRQVGDGADFMEGWQGSKLRCFKCGGNGHFAKDCTAEAQAQADMGALAGSSSDEEEEGSGGGGRQQGVAAAAAPQQHQQPGGGTHPSASAASQPWLTTVAAAAGGPSLPDPADEYAEVLADPSEAALTGVLHSMFGHTAFRGLQLPTLQRLLGGESLLSIMPTGMGKSLCYQLPAALLPGLCLVVSPLIALMHDQAASVPPPLAAAVLWSGQSRADALQVLVDVAAGRIKILFVSPERLNNPHLLEALRPRMPLPLVVVDEAHCVAEWGHSFRPAYFRLGAALASSVQAQRILALTATATRATETAIREVLRIPEGSVLRDAAVRQNLRLRVLRTTGGGSSQATRERICGLFSSGPLAGVRSAIVYCAFKEDANQLARMLGSRGITSRAYHAGKDYRERSATEADFAAGRVRVVVATVAFGMGINLAAVGAVVHATLPRSLEEYVQQVGRAGRDGSEARCVALLDDGDFVRLRSLAFSSVLDLAAVRGFLGAVFSPAAEGERVRHGGKAAKAKAAKAAALAAKAGGSGKGRKRKAATPEAEEAEEADGPEEAAGGAIVEEATEAAAAKASGSQQQQHQAEVAVAAAEASSSQQQQEEAAGNPSAGAGAGEAAALAPRRFGVLAAKQLASELDMREDSMEAVLSYLEADEQPCLRMLPTTALSVKVSFYAAAAEQLALQYPVVRAVLEACPNPRNGMYSAPAAKLAAVAQKAPGLVLQELRAMAAGSLIGFELSRDEGQAYEILHTPQDLDSLARQVHDRLTAVLACQVSRLDVSYRALAAALQAGLGAEAEEQQAAQEAALRVAMERYFDDHAAAGQPGAINASTTLLMDTQGLPLRRAEPALLQAARAVLRRNREQAGPALSGRALARILHGVGSPAFPPDAWHKRMGAFWGSQAHIDFGAVLKAAEIVVRDDA